MQYTKSFPPENPITEFENEIKPFDLPSNTTHPVKSPPLSSAREPLHHPEDQLIRNSTTDVIKDQLNNST